MTDRQKHAEWCAKNPERVKGYRMRTYARYKAWRKENPEAAKAHDKAVYAAADKESRLRSGKKWAKKNPDKVRAIKARSCLLYTSPSPRD